METLEQLVKDEMFPGKTPSRSLHDCFASRFDFQRLPPPPTSTPTPVEEQTAAIDSSLPSRNCSPLL